MMTYSVLSKLSLTCWIEISSSQSHVLKSFQSRDRLEIFLPMKGNWNNRKEWICPERAEGDENPEQNHKAEEEGLMKEIEKGWPERQKNNQVLEVRGRGCLKGRKLSTGKCSEKSSKMQTTIIHWIYWWEGGHYWHQADFFSGFMGTKAIQSRLRSEWEVWKYKHRVRTTLSRSCNE